MGIKLKDILLNPINECIITHSILDKKVIMAKNRDRAYTAKVKVVRELVGQI